MKQEAIFSLLVGGAAAFPWVADVDGVRSPWSRLNRRQQTGDGPGGPETCPFNPVHRDAAPITDEFPYNGARNGRPGRGIGGFQVPAPGDTAHEFQEPTSRDIRGPCPGLNAAANHNFLARDGITTFEELVDAQQNIYNVGYDLSNLLAILGLTLTDGDIVTGKLSIGCDATSRTSFNPLLTGSEPGLSGHNKFEADTSLTRDDFFFTGDNFSFNSTLFAKMEDTCNGNFNRENLAVYRRDRYYESRATNDNFFFGPLSLLLFGAASFLYELMPNGNRGYAPDLETISSFFGAEQDDEGQWFFNNREKIPDNWTNRVEPYSNSLVTQEILAMYLEQPVLFGGSTGNGGFNAINFGFIENGELPVALDPADTSCLLYQLAFAQLPGYLNAIVTPTVETLSFIASRIDPELDNLGCPRALT